MSEATSIKRTDLWTKEDDEALKRGILKHGDDWENIHETEKEVLGHRTAMALESRIKNLKNCHSKNKHNIL